MKIITAIIKTLLGILTTSFGAIVATFFLLVFKHQETMKAIETVIQFIGG